MTHETSTIPTADGVELFARSWTPDRGARAFVALIHGIGEHSGRYAYVASALMRDGIAVRAVDLRGHGHSPGRRVHVESYDAYVHDATALLRATCAEAAGRPVVLMGHSLGGLIAALTVVERGTDGLAGLVLSSPSLRLPHEDSRVLMALLPLAARWLPALPMGRLELAAISRDPAVVRALEEDPLVVRQPVRADQGLALLEAMRRVRQRPDAFDIPLYLFHGTADRITDPAGTAWLAEHAGTADVTHRTYEGLYHETLNEPERDAVIGDLRAWLAQHIPPRSDES